MRTASLTLVLLAVLSTGCMGTNRALDKGTPAGPVGVVTRGDDETRFAWRKVSMGPLNRAAHMGYIKWRSLDRDELGRPLAEGERVDVTWVYDTDFNLVGCLSPKGATLRFSARGEPESLGNMRLEDSLRAIFDAPERDVPVHFSKVRAPRI